MAIIVIVIFAQGCVQHVLGNARNAYHVKQIVSSARQLRQSAVFLMTIAALIRIKPRPKLNRQKSYVKDIFKRLLVARQHVIIQLVTPPSTITAAGSDHNLKTTNFDKSKKMMCGRINKKPPVTDANTANM